ncbi:MAG TPA: MFS transporter [Microvirga sp.]|jgi:predicted MFS family arabinose efflux permease|nr:MFS transporter [Microvirga sp.]
MTAEGSSRRLILILATGGFASTFSSRALEPLVGVVARDLSSSVETVALLSAAFTLPYAFIQPILGPVGDALGKERVMKACLLVLALSLAASAAAPDTGTLFVLRVVSGAAAGGVIPLSLALLGDRVPMAVRQVAISRFVVAIITGQLAGSSLAGFLAAGIGWRGVVALSMVITAASLAATLMGFRGRTEAGAFDLSVAAERYRGILADPRARALFLLVFGEAVAVFGVFPYVAPLLESRGGGGPAEAGLALAGFAIGGLAYSALVAWMLRNLGLRRMLALGGILGAAALIVVGFAGHWTWDAAAMVVLGFGFYLLHNAFQTQVTEVAPHARASAVALHAFSFFVGQSLGVVAIGLGLRTLGQLPSLLLAAALILTVGLVAAQVIGRTVKKAH